MNWETSPGTRPVPYGNGKGNTKVIGREKTHFPVRGDSLEPAQTEPKSLVSLSLSLGGFTRDDPRVIAALEVYLEDLRAGRPWSRDEFLARHAEIADALSQCLTGLEFIQGAAAQLGGSQVFSVADPANALPPRAQLGDYRILREVGRGGMGVVYEAEQVSLGRRVALKVLPFAAAIDPKQRQRFQIEAQAAAQLHHPHIVPIFNVGCDQGIHYYAMQFVEGRSLAAVLHELRHGHEAPTGVGRSSVLVELQPTDEAPPSSAGALDAGPAHTAALEPSTVDPDQRALTGPETVSTQSLGLSPSNLALAPTAVGPVHQDRAFCHNIARLGAEAADALDHAHGLGILHRDIKPANLLIDPHGALWITDFGLARFPSDLSLTHTGDMVGTLRYMSPEQALARRGVVDQRTDIYSLGVTLYELVTLRPAFDGRDHQELLRQIALDEPVSPRRLNPAVPRDLETIVLKAMAKDPSSRYATAQELATDLSRFLDDQPILARRPGAPERALRWARRHKELVATAAAILVLALTISTAAIWAQARKTELANQKRIAFVIDSYPFLHREGTRAIQDASGPLLLGQADTATRKEASEILEQWLRFFQQAIELPPNDLKSREVIARAYSRLGYTHWMLSIANGFEPRLQAEALAEYRRSVDLLEKLLADSPGDQNIRRYLAEALGLGNMGCCLRTALRTEEAESLYRRAIQIRRELLRGTGSGSVADVRVRADVAGELDDLPYLVSTVHLMAGLLDAKGRVAEAEGLRRQLQDDIVAVAARLSEPKFQQRRQMWVERLTSGQLPLFDGSRRRDMMINHRLALILDASNATVLNNLAWSLAGVPGDPWFDPAQGLILARKAVAIEPNEWTYLNTLGVAAFRAHDWETAAKVFHQATTFTGGGAYNFFFLAMTYWHQGNKKEAREMYDRAVAWTDKNKPDDPELRQFRAEAAALLGQPCPKPNGTHQAETDEGLPGTAHAKKT
ncbi:MAG: protein kinase [Isosphaerales bacterium]